MLLILSAFGSQSMTLVNTELYLYLNMLNDTISGAQLRG